MLSQDLKGKLTHVCKGNVEALLRGEFKLQGTNGMKPNGVWLSWNGGWEDWCSSEQPDWLENRLILSATLKPDLNIFLIDSLEDFQKVFDEFSKLPVAKTKMHELIDSYKSAGLDASSPTNSAVRSFTLQISGSG